MTTAPMFKCLISGVGNTCDQDFNVTKNFHNDIITVFMVQN